MNDLVLKEVWRDIKGFEGLYQVSNLGRVASLPRPYHPNWTLVATSEQRVHNYVRCVVTLWKGGKTYMRKLHRLIAEAFIENPMGLDMVNHIDSNPLNNDISNLEWSNAKLNSMHGMRFGSVKDRVKVEKEEYVKIAQLYEANVPIRDIAKMYGITHRNVHKYVRMGGGKVKNSSDAHKKYPIDVAELEYMLDRGFTQVAIAKAYGCSPSTISRLKTSIEKKKGETNERKHMDRNRQSHVRPGIETD